MGQQLSSIDCTIPDLSTTTNEYSNWISPDGSQEDVLLFLPLKTVDDVNASSLSHIDPHQQTSTTQTLIKQIRNHLSLLMNSSELNELETQFTNIIQPLLDHIKIANTNILNEIQSKLDKQYQLQNSYAEKLKEDENADATISAQLFINLNAGLSLFATQSTISILLILTKSAEKNDPTIIREILRLTSQLVEQIPMKYISSDIYKRSSLLSKSLKFLTNYINELSIRIDIDPLVAKQTVKILLNFSILKASFKDILPLLCKLVCNTTDIYDIRRLCIELNKQLTETIEEQDNINNISGNTDDLTSDICEYLKSIGAFPNTQLIELDVNKFTGQFISTILLAHIDFHNKIQSKLQFVHGLFNNSFSFEFHPNTFKQLFNLIEQLTIEQSSSNTILTYMLTACLRLFTTHLQFLMALNIENFHIFATDDDIQKWFILILKLALNNQSHEICKEASTALIYLIDKSILSCADNLSFIHEYIVKNKHPVLIEQLFRELGKGIIVCYESINDKKTAAFTILCSFIDSYFTSNSIEEQKSKVLQQFLLTFQELLLIQLTTQSSDQASSSLSTLAVQYATHIITYYMDKTVNNDFLQLFLRGLCTLTESKVNFTLIQPIFIAVIPLFAEYVLQTINTKDFKNDHLISIMLGKMTNRLIAGSIEDPLETKYIDILKLPIFSGGCETNITQNNPYLLDLFKSNLAIYSQIELPNQTQSDEFLMSVYNNIDQGAKLISKMKIFIKDKKDVLDKIIVQQANDICAAVFAVYIKHYRRIDLAKHELSQPIDQKPHDKLMSIYEYANDIQTFFTSVKTQDVDFNELYKQIKSNALVLLEVVKESNFISTIKQDLSKIVQQSEKREISQWTKAKDDKQINDSENVLKRAITTYLLGNDTSISTISESNKIESNELIKCLIRQYERAVIRLITYRFIHKFIEKLIKMKDNHQIYSILTIYLPYIKNFNSEWHYLENISASNIQLKENIAQNYYSIIKTLTSFLLQSISELTMKNLFYLMNLPYQTIDLCYLHHFQFIETFFTSFISFVQPESVQIISLNTKLIGYNWFRMFVLELCENIQMEELKNIQFGNRRFHQVLKQQRNLVFHTLILTELKSLTTLRQKSITNEIYRNPSLNNAAIEWFITIAEKKSSTIDIDLCTNQLLMLLLRCIHLYDHVRSVCATYDYIQELLNIYHNSLHITTRLLALKILRDLVILVPSDTNGTMTDIIQNLLTDILFYIGENFNQHRTIDTSIHIVIEFIYIYRTLMSEYSPWQKIATKLIIDALKSSLNFNLTSLESIDIKQMNFFLASFCIFGGYVRPYCLGSVVQVHNQLESGMIIEVGTSTQELDTSDPLSYLVQYTTTNKTKWIMENELQIITDIQPPNLILLPMIDESQATVHSILDTLGYFAQIDTSTTDSLMLLQIKRRSIAAFYSLLNNKQLVEIFMQKPYVSLIAKLSISSHNDNSTVDLQLLNRLHLEQYSLSLDRCERAKKIVSNEQNVPVVWNHVKINRDPLFLNAISTTILECNGWRPYVSKFEIRSFQQGRMGDSELNIVPLRPDVRLPEPEECGTKHKFKGRINVTNNTDRLYYPTFFVKNLQLSEGKWYYCIRPLLNRKIVIGWATNGFSPTPDVGRGVGDDEYSWGYTGLHGRCFHNYQRIIFRDEIRWKKDDVCGCGIEINGEHTVIKYWLNGKLLGTCFSHTSNTNIESSSQCNMLPNGSNTTYFPTISVHVYGKFENTSMVEFIFNPEDMIECPLPEGYKPLLLPKLINIENLLVAYPSNAYLISNYDQDYFHTIRHSQSESMDEKCCFLRDFVNNHHLETTFTIDAIIQDNHLLKLSKDYNGLPLSIDNHESLTISFDFEILTTNTTENSPNELDIILFALDNRTFSIQIPLNKVNDDFMDEMIPHRNRITVIFQANEHTKIYMNNQYQTLDFYHTFDSVTKTKLNLHILPYIDAGIKNLGIWNYPLSEEHIQRLFIYGLSYVATDYRRLKEYRREVNTFTFTQEQQYFINELLIPFNQPFDTNIWEMTKKQVNHNESIYFKAISGTNQSVVQLFGNKTYLVLDTSANLSSEYTLILDIFIPSFPKKNSSSMSSDNNTQLTLVTLDIQSEIYITHDGHLCISNGEQSESTLNLNEYIRLVISIQRKYLKIYVNSLLQFHTSIIYDQFKVKFGHIDLFREIDLTKNMINEDQLRIECKSITFINKSIDFSSSSIIKELIKSTEFSLDKLTIPPFSILSSSLIGIGYKEEWIKFVIKHYNTTNIQLIDTIIREQNQLISKTYMEEQQLHKTNILSPLNSCVDEEQMLVEYDMKLEKQWYCQSIHGLGIYDKLIEWIQDKNSTKQSLISDPFYKLLDLNKSEQGEMKTDNGLRKNLSTFIPYVHRQMTQKQYFNSRRDCEYQLITIYARCILLNMLKVWSTNDQLRLFPIEKFGDDNFIIKLLRLIDYHYRYEQIQSDEIINRIKLPIVSILKAEMKEVLTQNLITDEIFKTKAPSLYQLQKYIIDESIRFLMEPSLLDINNNDDEPIHEQTIIKQLNLDFLFKTIYLFLELLTDNSIEQYQIDLIIPFLFPTFFIKILFDLFLLAPSHQSKIFILHIFTRLIQISDKFNLNENIQDFVLQLWIELITNKILIDNSELKNLRIALMDLSFALFKRHQQFLSKLDLCFQIVCNEFEYIGEWTPTYSSYIYHVTIVLKIKDDYKEETNTVPIQGYILWKLKSASEDSGNLYNIGHAVREFVEGTFQRDTRQMEFAGVRKSVGAEGLLNLGRYQFIVSQDETSCEGGTYADYQSDSYTFQGKTRKAIIRETIEENIKDYQQNSKQQLNYELMHKIDTILLNI